MNRDELRDKFSPLLDGELAADERAEIEAVLAQDAELLRELDSLKRVDDLFRSLPKPRAPEGFEAGVRELVQPQLVAIPMHHSRRRVWPALVAAAVLLMTAGIFFVQTRSQLQPTAERFDVASSKAAEAEPIVEINQKTGSVLNATFPANLSFNSNFSFYFKVE